MEMKSTNIKLVLAAIYLLLIIVAASYLIGNYNISDFFSYEFIRVNKNTILEYKKENFLALTIIFFIFSIVWILLLGFAIGEKARPTPYRGVVFCNHPFAGVMSFQSAH